LDDFDGQLSVLLDLVIETNDESFAETLSVEVLDGLLIPVIAHGLFQLHQSLLPDIPVLA
jgi:hypothetical protein